MLRGVYCSNTGLNTIQSRVDILSDNVSNVNTPGFKQGKSTVSTFKEAMIPINENKAYFRTSNGTSRAREILDFSSGPLQQTGEKFDFAVKGDVFFTLDTPAGTVYTKKGRFSCNAGGFLVDDKGNRVMGTNGFIRVLDGQLDRDFRLVAIRDQESIIPQGDGLFAVEDPAGVSLVHDAQVLPGFIEAANVDLTYNMVEMMAALRGYSLNSRALAAQDALLKKASEEVGKVK